MEQEKRKKYSGMTLIEMMMAISIFTIGIGGFTLLFMKTWNTNSYTIEMGQSSMAVSQGLNRIVDYTRRARQGDDGAYPIVSANGNDFVFYCDFDKDGTTERVHIYKSNSDILIGATDPTETLPKTYPSGDQETFTIATDIVNDASSPVFSYYNKDYPSDTTNNPMSTPARLADVRLVRIYLQINTDPGRGPENIETQSFVEMRNLNDYNQNR